MSASFRQEMERLMIRGGQMEGQIASLRERLNALTSERDEAVRVAEAYREALVLVRHITNTDTHSAAYMANEAAEDMAELHEMVVAILDSLTASTGGSLR